MSPESLHGLDTPVALADWIAAHPIGLVLFTQPGCAACDGLVPALSARLGERFPELPLAAVDCADAPAVAGQSGVFSVPTVCLFLDGREAQRWSRHFALADLLAAIARPYAILHGAERYPS